VGSKLAESFDTFAVTKSVPLEVRSQVAIGMATGAAPPTEGWFEIGPHPAPRTDTAPDTADRGAKSH
jgi:hypothetical protein